jgi:hypothetical protein
METSKGDLLQTLRMMAKPQPSLEDVFAILSDFKNLGGTQAEALDVLEQLRSESQDEETEDYILDMMDIAAGWCAVKFRVWSEESSSS